MHPNVLVPLKLSSSLGLIQQHPDKLLGDDSTNEHSVNHYNDFAFWGGSNQSDQHILWVIAHHMFDLFKRDLSTHFLSLFQSHVCAFLLAAVAHSTSSSPQTYCCFPLADSQKIHCCPNPVLPEHAGKVFFE
jgi:hypothetical protein